MGPRCGSPLRGITCTTRGSRTYPANALIRPRFIPISRFDKSICRGERVISKWRGSAVAAPWKFLRRLCVSSRGYFKFQGGGLVQARIDISTSDRVMPWEMYLRGMSFEVEGFCPRDSFSNHEIAIPPPSIELWRTSFLFLRRCSGRKPRQRRT